jgi:hypothetical protein
VHTTGDNKQPQRTTGGQNMKLVTELQLMDTLHLGRTKAREIGREAGARVKIGRRTLYDLDRIEKHIAKFYEVPEEE